MCFRSKERAEELKITTDVMKESKWTDDKDIENCQQCNKTFSVARRRVSKGSGDYSAVVFISLSNFERRTHKSDPVYSIPLTY